MPLPDLIGHEELRQVLSSAARGGTLPQSILMHGPAGAGKERLALWLAQLLLCEKTFAEPCGECRSCRTATTLQHPDLHWFFPLPRPESTSPEKLRDRLEELRASELQEWRNNPVRVPQFEKAAAYFLAAIRTIQQLASVRPAVGSQKVFVVADAELMVPQEGSQEAANAFLKLLEEPPSSTTIVITSSQPGALLPTIRSRVTALRVRPLRDEEIEAFVVRTGLANPAHAAPLARRARGSISRAILLGQQKGGRGGDPTREAGRELLFAALTTGGTSRLAAAHDRRPSGARADLIAELDSLAEWLRDLAAVAAGAPDQVYDQEAVPHLTRYVEQRDISPEAVPRAIGRVSAARRLAFGNVNPQLIVADLLTQLQRELVGSAGVTTGGR